MISWAMNLVLGSVTGVLLLVAVSEHSQASWYEGRFETAQARADNFQRLTDRAVTAGERCVVIAEGLKAENTKLKAAAQ